MNSKTLYALDFDGVICHSAVETAMTGWKAAQSLWLDMQQQMISGQHIRQFGGIRPCLEFGSEAVLIMRLLQQGIAMSALCEGYHQQLASLVEAEKLDRDELQILFGDTRDKQIQQDESVWIDNNPLFEGIVEKLKRLDQDDWFIITTKQERFVKRILQSNGIELDEARIFGLERKLNKQSVLEIFSVDYPERHITFIEDRLPTLLGVMENPRLLSIKLQLVDWGYNTELEREQARQKGIEVIGKEDFLCQG